MPTLLVNPRMSPELAARLERRVGLGFCLGRRRDANERAFHRAKPASIARLFPLIALAIVVGLYVVATTYEGNALERRRAALLDTIAERRAALGPRREAVPLEVQRWAGELVNEPPPEDAVAAEIASSALLDARLARPTLYLRARASDLGSKEGLATAVTAVKDAFLLCLYAPPPSREANDVLVRVRGVLFGGSRLDTLTPSVRRWEPARDGLAALDAEHEGRVRKAESEAVLRSFEHALDVLPADAPAHATQAELLVLVADEADARRSRVALVDLRARRPLLRTSLRHDDKRWSAERRAALGDSLAGCELALHVRQLAADGRQSAR